MSHNVLLKYNATKNSKEETGYYQVKKFQKLKTFALETSTYIDMAENFFSHQR